MKTTRQKYERKLEKAISKSGGINLIVDNQEIGAILIAEPKELFAVDNIEIISIDAILQEVATGKVMIQNKEFGMMSFDFDFVGSLEECNHYIDEMGSNEITFEELINGATPQTLKLLLERAREKKEDTILKINENTTINEFLRMAENIQEGINIEIRQAMPKL